MAVNFEPAVLELLPWAYMSLKSGLSGSLLDMIGRGRSFGVAISMTAAVRNEAVAKW